MKKKRGKEGFVISIHLTNRWLYILIAIGILAVIGVGVYAYGTSSPSTFGHSAGELNVDINGDGIIDKTLQQAIDNQDFGGVETDPTITDNSVKDGVSWSEISGIPSGFTDGVDNVGSSQLTPCDVIIGPADAQRSVSRIYGYRKIKEIVLTKGSGTIRVTWQARGSTLTTHVSSRIYVNDNGVTARKDTIEGNTNWNSFSEDISVSEGDKIQLWAYRFGDIRYFRLRGCVPVMYVTTTTLN